ncbi:MAG: PQQ-binding-like beta-propeller repeat protein [Planctomycetota bacterium]|nr:PQQ-binding-like beta-propeller repeat protein [Planctomycetota bacterium]
MAYLRSAWRGGAMAAAAAGAVLLACGVLWSAGQAGGGKDWPGFLGAQRDGSSSETGWSTDWGASGPKTLWQAQVGVGYSCVSVSDGKAYTMGNAADVDTVFCFDAVKGDVIWKKTYPCKGGSYPGPRCSPTVDGARVYTVSIEGLIACWDAAKETPLWSHKASEYGGNPGNWGFACSPLILGDRVIVDVGVTVAFNKNTGELAWKTPPHKAGYSSPKAFRSGARDLLAVFAGDGLQIFSADKGEPIAATPWKTSYDVNAALPIISGDGIFITSGYGKGGALLQLQDKALTKAWEKNELSSQFSTPVLLEGYLYGVTGNVNGGQSLTCLELKSGAVKWTAPGSGATILVGGKLVILGSKGRLAVAQASPDAYKELAATELGAGEWWNAPTLSHGLIYCRSHQGRLVCLDVRP